MLGGFFFIIPLVILIYLLKKALDLILPLGKSLVDFLGIQTLFNLATDSLAGITLLVFVAISAGFLITKGFLKPWGGQFEEKLFLFFPGVQMLKFRLMDNQKSNEERLWKPILLREENSFKIAFITDERDPAYLSLYMPDAPRMDAGEIRFVLKEECVFIPISMKDALNAMHQFGRGIMLSSLLAKSDLPSSTWSNIGNE